MPNFFDQVDKRNYRICEFVKKYGICRTKVYQEIQAGRLGVLKAGKNTLIPIEAAEAWQAALKKGIVVIK